MKRRDFLKTSVVAGVALSLNFEGLQAALSSNTVAVEQAPDLVAVMGGEPAVMLDKALEALGGIGKYIKKGQKVVIKPNIGWDRTPELAGNTNPELIKALVKKCFEAGAEKVTVFDHTCDNWQKCYETSGIAAAVKEAGGIIMPGNDEKIFQRSRHSRRRDTEKSQDTRVTDRSGRLDQCSHPEEPRRSQAVMRNEEYDGDRLGPPLLPPERLAAMYRRYLYLEEETGSEHRGCLPHDASERSARKKCS